MFKNPEPNPKDYQVPTQEQPRQPTEGGYILKPHHFEERLGYTPSYWERPSRIGRYYQALQSLPPGAKEPDWLDRGMVETAYKYLQWRNGNRPWWEWRYLPANDPARQMLQELPAPPAEFMWPDEQQLYPQPQQGGIQGGPEVSPGGGFGWMDMTDDEWAQLPGWQKIAASIMSSPYTQGAMTMLPWSLMGAAGGMAAGPMGALMGFLSPQIAGLALGFAGDPATYEKVAQATGNEEFARGLQTIAGGALQMLNLPAEWTEQGLGVLSQATYSALEPDKYGSLEDLLANLPAAWRAAQVSYETTAPVYTAVSNFPAWLEKTYEMLTKGETDAVLAQRGQVHVLGQAGPVDVDLFGIAALVAARREIAGGAPPELVIEKYRQMYDFSGSLTDLVYQSAADPLNILPIGERKVVGLFARLTDNPALALAAKVAVGEGLIGTTREYGRLLRGGYGPDVAHMTPRQRRLAGITPEGVIDELRPGRARGVGRALFNVSDNPFNPIAWINSMNELTPQAKARALLGLAHDNAGVLLNLAGDSPEEMVRLVRAWKDLPPAEAAEVAKILGLPEAATVRQALSDFGPELNELEASWTMGQANRDILLKISAAIGETPAKTLEMMRAGKDGAANVHQRLLDAARQRGEEGAGLLADPTFTPEALKGLVAYFDGNPWHPDHFRANLHNALLQHTSEWAVRVFGIKPDSKFSRFFQGLKSVQSLLLLGMNPAYLVNNAMNNVVTRAADGVYGLVSSREISKFFDDFGIKPYRLRAGIGAADVGVDIDASFGKGVDEGIANAEYVLRSAGRAKDWVQNFQDAADNASRWGVMSRLAQANERMESQGAMYIGVKGAWGRLWNRRGAIPQMPSWMRQTLSRVDRRLPGAIMTAIEHAKSVQDVDRILVNLVLRRTVEPYIDGAAEALGMQPADLRQMLHETGALDIINRRLDQGASVGDAFASAEQQVQEAMDRRLRTDLITRARDAEARVQGEGFAATLDIWKDLQIRQEELWTRHFAEWQRTMEMAYADGVSVAARRRMIRERSEIANREWRMHQAWERTTQIGVLRALGFMDPAEPARLAPAAQQYAKAMIELHESWDQFFRERDELYNVFFNTNFKDKKARTRAWHDLQNKLLEMYQQRTVTENQKNRQLGAAFLELWAKQYGPARSAGAAEWWQAVMTLATRRQQLMHDFRMWLNERPVSELTQKEVIEFVTGRAPGDRLTAWPEFLKQVYLPLIGEIIQSGLDGAWRMHQDANGAAPDGDVPRVDAVRKYEETLEKLRREGDDGQAEEDRPVGPPQPPQPIQPAGPQFLTPTRELAPEGPEPIAEQPRAPVPNEGSNLYEFNDGSSTLLHFEDDVDSALFSAFGSDKRHIEWLRRVFPGVTDKQIETMVNELRTRIDELTKDHKGDDIVEIPKQGIRPAEPTKDELRAEREKQRQIEQDIREGVNAGLMGPRDKLDEAYPFYPKAMIDDLSESIMYEALAMRDEMPADGDKDATVDIIPENGEGYTISQNAMWYRELRKEYKALGKELDRGAVMSALERIIEDEGRDTVRTNEQTIVDVKRVLIDRMRQKGYPVMEFYDLGDIGRLMEAGEMEGAVDIFTRWMEGPYDILPDEWGELVGDPVLYDQLLQMMIERAEQRVQLDEGNMPGPVQEAVDTFRSDVEIESKLADWQRDLPESYERVDPDQDVMLDMTRQAEEEAYTGEERRIYDELRAEVDRLKAENEKLKTDPDLDIPLYTHFREEWEGAPAKIAVDVQGLKWVNDTYGFESGNELLRAFVQAAQEDGGKVYRVGGDEFLLTAGSLEEGQRIADEIRERFKLALIIVEDENGQEKIYTGFDIYTGVGADFTSAYAGVDAAKREFKAANPSVQRGGQPPTVREFGEGEGADLAGGDAGDAGVPEIEGAARPAAEEEEPVVIPPKLPEERLGETLREMGFNPGDKFVRIGYGYGVEFVRDVPGFKAEIKLEDGSLRIVDLQDLANNYRRVERAAPPAPEKVPGREGVREGEVPDISTLPRSGLDKPLPYGTVIENGRQLWPHDVVIWKGEKYGVAETWEKGSSLIPLGEWDTSYQNAVVIKRVGYPGDEVIATGDNISWAAREGRIPNSIYGDSRDLSSLGNLPETPPPAAEPGRIGYEQGDVFVRKEDGARYTFEGLEPGKGFVLRGEDGSTIRRTAQQVNEEFEKAAPEPAGQAGAMFGPLDDTPLGSGTAVRGSESTFAPQEVTPQGVMPGFEEAMQHPMKGPKVAPEGGDLGPLFGEQKPGKGLTTDRDYELPDQPKPVEVETPAGPMRFDPSDRAQLVEALVKLFGYTEEMANIEADLLDVVAETWSQRTGRPAAEFWRDVELADKPRLDDMGESLAQWTAREDPYDRPYRLATQKLFALIERAEQNKADIGDKRILYDQIIMGDKNAYAKMAYRDDVGQEFRVLIEELRFYQQKTAEFFWGAEKKDPGNPYTIRKRRFAPDYYLRAWKEIAPDHWTSPSGRYHLLRNWEYTVDNWRYYAAQPWSLIFEDGYRINFKSDEEAKRFAWNDADAHGTLFQVAPALAKKVHSQEFREWFGESKIVDDDGDPLVVYHGTRKNFIEYQSLEGTDQIGYHFGNVKQAEYFANDKTRGLILPVYLKMVNPLVVNYDFGSWDLFTFGQYFSRVGEKDIAQDIRAASYDFTNQLSEEIDKIAKDYRENYLDKGIDNYETTAEFNRQNVEVQNKFRDKRREWLVDYLTSKGYDGVIYPNQVEGEGLSYLVFRPEQIKSVFNQGSFGAEIPNILQQEILGQQPRGVYGRLETGKRVIGALEGADADTFIHESAHFFFDTALVDERDRQAVMRFAGVDDLAGDNYRAAQETFADGYVRWRMDGKAPNSRLRALFERFRSFLRSVLDRLTKAYGLKHDFNRPWIPGKPLDAEMEKVYSRLFELDPWELTRGEWLRQDHQYHGKHGVFLLDERSLADYHKMLVVTAVKEGRQVPGKVLAEYPGLVEHLAEQLRAGDVVPLDQAAVTEYGPASREQALMDRLVEDMRSGKFYEDSREFEKLMTDYQLFTSREEDLNLAYDILEGAMNIIAREERKRASGPDLIDRIVRMAFLEVRLAKARRTLSKMELQQFSTPLTISEAAGWAADVQPGDIVMEPTAGTANLVDMHYGREDVELLVNEIDPGRVQVLRLLGYNPTETSILSSKWVLDHYGRVAGPAANVIISNPPWGSYSKNIYGRPVNDPVVMNDWSQRFTYLIMRRLAEGGRFVGVMPTNWLYTEDRRTRTRTDRRSEFLKWLEDHYTVQAIIESPEGAYKTRATGVGSLLIVVDKTPAADNHRILEWWGGQAPKNWDQYARLVSAIPARNKETIGSGQDAVRDARIRGRTPRPASGPDATGLVDPAARRGESRGDPERIGDVFEPGPEPGPGRPAGEGTEQIPGVGGSDVGREPTGEPAGGTPGAGRAARSGDADATERDGMGAAGEAADAGEPGGAGGDLAAELVAEEPAGVPAGAAGATPEYSQAFQEKLDASRRAAQNSGEFTVYVARAPLGAGDHYHPHPSVVVETQSLAGVSYPELLPEYRPTQGVMDAVRRRTISVEGNLDAVWAAVQQNDKYGMGILVADDVGMGKSRTAAAFVIDRIQRGKRRILVITKGTQNVQNLMEVEFPGVWSGVANEYGKFIKPGTDFPARRVMISGENMPEVKRGRERIPVFDEPTVYFIADSQFANFEEAIRDLQVEVVVTDEVHSFKNIGQANRADSWVELHRHWLASQANILYLTATPGTDISDLEYLYGLRLWTVDGFSDWIGIITGQTTAAEAQRRADAVTRVQSYADILRDARETLNIERVERNVYAGYQWRTLRGFRVGDMFVHLDPMHPGHYYIRSISQDQVYTSGGPAAETEALLLADILNKNPQMEYSQAQAEYDRRYPRPATRDIQELGMTDASDVARTTDRRGRDIRKSTAFDATIPAAHTEQIMRELKAGGSFISRDISRVGVDFDVRGYEPTPEEIEGLNRRIALYRRIYDAWRRYGKMNQGKKAVAALFGVNGDIQGDAKRALFNMRLPGIIAEAKAAIERGEQVVISTVSVSETDAESGFLANAISKINTQEVHKIGNNQYSNPEEIPEALMEIAEIREELADMPTMRSPIDILSEVFGDRFTYVTGSVASTDERVKRMSLFQKNELDVILISGAGKTGINLHDMSGARRVHLIVGDYEWSATTFKQELGRVDRTGQLTSPAVTVMHSGNAAERKFVGTISNRMKGLGATSKGGAESTGTGALTDAFEFGTMLDRFALQAAWREFTTQQKLLFLDPYFEDKTVRGRNRVPRSTIDANANACHKFSLGLMSIPLKEGNELWTIFEKHKRMLEGGDAAEADAAAATAKVTGEVLRETQLEDNITLSEFRNKNGEKYGVVSGILTPYMNRIRTVVAGSIDSRALGESPNAWMRWVRIKDEQTGKYITGLRIPPGRIESLAKEFGKQAIRRHSKETALQDLRAGDTIPIIGEGLDEWDLYIGHSGARNGLIVIRGAKMRNKNSVMNNGGRYSAVGNFFYVEEGEIQSFLHRFPIRDAGAEQAGGERGPLFQMAPDGRPEPTPEAENRAAAIPDRFAVMQFPRPFELEGMSMIGMVFLEGKFIAWMPERWAVGREFDTAKGKARLLGMDGEGNWVFALEDGELVRQPVDEQGAPNAGGPLALGTMEAVAPVEYDSQTLSDGWANHVRPALDELKNRMLREDAPLAGDFGQLGQLSADEQSEMRHYLGQVKQEMSRAKLAALRHGEYKRDMALLNYSRRTGFDNYANIIFPYQFWYTRSMMNWAARALDRPAWLSFYARLHRFMEQRDDDGFPTRLKGKMHIPAPYLPEWMGGGLWVDPMSKLFPFAEFLRPIDRLYQEQSRTTQTAERMLRQWAESGEIDRNEAYQAASTREGSLWERAMAAARMAEESGDPISMMELFVSPAMYLTMPYRLASGQAEKIQPLPFTRALRGLQAATGLEALDILDVESKARRAMGLSEFGEWGDYYIDRQLANMAAEGLISARDAQLAMVERSGRAYDEAVKRVDLEQAMRQPGTAPILAGREMAAGRAGIGDLAGALLFGFLPSGLLPEGELKLRGLQDEYNQAWEAYNNGNKKAINEFFNTYPEYEARLALYDEPEERLRQFLVSEVWERWANLPALHKRELSAALGPVFEEAFMDPETRDYQAIPLDLLAQWSQEMGGYAPAGTSGPQVQLAPPGIAQAYQVYKETRDKQFPGWGTLQEAYFRLPAGAARRTFLGKFPVLSKYWDWRRAYLAEHPQMAAYLEQMEGEGSGQASSNQLSTSGGGGWPVVDEGVYLPTLTDEQLKKISPLLGRQLMAYYYGQADLGEGAQRALYRIWNELGQPGEQIDVFIREILWRSLNK